MKTTKIIFHLLLLVNMMTYAQESYTISGRIKDAKSGETIIGANIIKTDSYKGTLTNTYGFYSLTLPKGKHTLDISYIGFKSISKQIDLTSDITLNFELEENAEQLEAVVITANTEKPLIKKAEMSVNKLKVKTVKEIPAVLGEVDVLKSITTLPGVTTAGEGQSGFNVRGGAADQNLVLLDEATLFNTSHLFGLFSVINADAIKDLKLYKGGTPAMFGGRISSVLDIHQKDGNKKEFHGNGGIGLISSRLTLEGPIKKDKASFFVSGRRSYADLFIPLVQPDNKNKAFFYDLNTKLNWEFDDKNKFYVSGYFGRDVFTLDKSFINEYGNATANIRWNHVFNSRLFSNLSLIYSDYYYGLELDFVGFEWNSGLRNVNLKYDLSQNINDNITFNYGVSTIAHEFNPGEIRPNKPESTIMSEDYAKKYAIESGAYIDVEHRLNEKIDLRYGLRLSNFLRMGEDNYRIYDGEPVSYDADLRIYEQGKPIRTENRDRSEILKSFINLEPRFSIAYALTDNSSIKASYQRMAQYLHLVSNTQSPTPLDIWTPSGEFIKPQLSDQIAVGYQHDFNGKYTFTTEVFGKTVDNRIDYIDGADLVGQEAIESVILNGEARAYGLEVLLRKETGRFKGWISYTLSKSEQRTQGRTADEIGINNGDWYATAYNKTHDLSIVGSYNISKKWKLNANFTYQTGQPFTFATEQYQFRGRSVPNYGPRNGDNLTDYHRLDVAATYKSSKKLFGKANYEWVFSVYNLYNRQNASAFIFSQDTDNARNKTERLTIFGLLPSVTFNFKF